MLRHAKDEGYIAANPVDELPKRARPSRERQPRGPGVGRTRACATVRRSHRALRADVPGEGLHGRATITRQIDDQDRGERVALKSKTLRDRRTVPLIAGLVEPLRDRRAMEQEHGRGKPGDWVFNIDAAHVTYPTFAYRFESAVTGAGLGNGPDLTPHSLRHGFGSLILAFGHPLVTVSAWLGHKRTSTTERWYLDARRTVNETVNTEASWSLPQSPRLPGGRCLMGLHQIESMHDEAGASEPSSVRSIPVARFRT